MRNYSVAATIAGVVAANTAMVLVIIGVSTAPVEPSFPGSVTVGVNSASWSGVVPTPGTPTVTTPAAEEPTVPTTPTGAPEPTTPAPAAEVPPPPTAAPTTAAPVVPDVVVVPPAPVVLDDDTDDDGPDDDGPDDDGADDDLDDDADDE